jgi:hypothetical protein
MPNYKKTMQNNKKNNLTNLTYISFFFYILLTNDSFAYLDPVSGSILLQILFAIFAAIIVFLKKIKSFILRIFKKNKKQ